MYKQFSVLVIKKR